MSLQKNRDRHYLRALAKLIADYLYIYFARMKDAGVAESTKAQILTKIYDQCDGIKSSVTKSRARGDR